MTVLGLRSFRAGSVLGSLLSQYQITPSLGSTGKRGGRVTSDETQAICFLAWRGFWSQMLS